MKQILVIFSLFFSFSLFAQQSEGTIYFNQSVKLDIELPKGQEHLRDMIPSTSDQAKALYFTKSKSMYKDLSTEDDAKEINQESDGTEMQVKIVSGSADNRLLKDFDAKKIVDQRDFMGKKFLINEDLEEVKWKVTGEQKKVLDYTCIRATHQKEDQEIIAWFTPQIPISNGPGQFGALPGMILEMILEDGRITITATKVELGAFDQNLLETPKKGKKVSKAEFKKIREEKMKEMGSENGRTVIRMETNDRGR